MTNQIQANGTSGRPNIYQIRVAGHLEGQWSDWFEGLSVDLEPDGSTVLTGQVIDQAALHGLLRKVRDLGLPLLSVVRISSTPADAMSATRGKGTT